MTTNSELSIINENIDAMYFWFLTSLTRKMKLKSQASVLFPKGFPVFFNIFISRRVCENAGAGFL